MVNLNLYKIFIAVADCQNISKASEMLYISQPAVSFSVKELERVLGQVLFIRKSKGVELTTFGKVLYNKLKGVINQFDEAEILADKFTALQEGVIRIGANSSNVNQMLLQYLSEFAKKYPNIKIFMTRGTQEELLKQLENNEQDIIFVDNCEQAKDFRVINKIKVKYQLIGDKTYKAKYPQRNITAKDFPINELVLPTKNNNSRITINKFFENENIKLSPKYELDNYILLYEFVKKGFGMAFVNIDYYKTQVENKEVEVIFDDFSLYAREIVCLTNNDSSNFALNKFIGIIRG